MEPVVRAVDVGRGNTKYIADIRGGEPQCAMFPSQAHPNETAYELDGWGTSRKTVSIPVGSLVYEVGPDVHLAADVFNSNVLQHDRYAETPEYLALVLGALHYMAVDTIDLLIVGLPVATFKLKRHVSALERRLTGEHALGKGRRVYVKRVKAIAQPAGALMYFGLTQNRVAQLRKERSLIVDPGRRTFDWIVTQGMQQIDKRSHSVPRGMHDVLHALVEGISRNTGAHFRESEMVDTALRTGKKLVIFQKDYDLAQDLPLARKVPEQAIAEMMHYVGDAGDIRNIVQVGGGAFFYKPALKAAFPNHAIQDLKDPIFANVKGFWYAGVELAKTLVGSKQSSTTAAHEAPVTMGNDNG